MKRTTLIAALLFAAAAASALASPASERRAIFKQYKQSLGSMNQMLKADNFDKAQFAAAAKALQSKAHAPWQHFPAGSANDDTSEDIWSDPKGFDKAAKDFEAKVGKLNQAAVAGDVGQIRASFRAVQQSCKACHDSYRN